jgi:hypothetical protein
MLNRLTLRRIIYAIRRGAYAKSFRLQSRKPPYAFNITENRTAIINYFASKVGATNYLEIGCAENTVFSNIMVSNKVGVDPVMGGTYRGTSDNFFTQNSIVFDVVFIDGMHTFEQVYRDVANALRSINVGGYILLHDMLPKSYEEQLVPCSTLGPWTGDVWKLNFLLSGVEGLEFSIINDDHGLGVIHKNNEKITMPSLEDFRDLDYDFYCENIKNLNIVEWEMT